MKPMAYDEYVNASKGKIQKGKGKKVRLRNGVSHAVASTTWSMCYISLSAVPPTIVPHSVRNP